MSNVIFQPPAGLTWSIKKRLRYGTIVRNTTSARGQLRIAKQVYPIFEYEMNWEYLTGSEQSAIGANAGLQQLMGFFMARQGAYDDFLYSDSNDNSVTGEQFATGDGATLGFQLQRTIGQGVDIVQNLDQSLAAPKIYKYDWQGTKNIVPFSEQLDQWSTSGAGPIIRTVNAGFAPDGSNNAIKISFTGTASAESFISISTGVVPLAGDSWTYSIWLRADTPTVVNLRFLQSTGENDNAPTKSVTTQWQQFSITTTTGSVGTGAILARLGKTLGTGTAVVYAWGAQIELGSSITAYQKTGVNNWGPLFQAGTFARKNWLLQSNGFDQAAWSKTNVTVTPNAITAPDGSNNAFKLAATATAATSCNQVANGSGLAAANTYSIFVKKGSGTTQANSFVLRNATTSTNLLSVTVNYDTGAITYITGSTGVTMYKMPNGWWRLSMTATSGISNGDNIQVYAGFIGNSETAGVFCYVFGAQLEQYGFNNSSTPYPWTGAGGSAGGGGSAYIPTTTVAVTVTDYSLGSTGVVTFAAAPASNALLTWDGSFFYRLHFTDDINDFDNFMYQLWDLQSVKFESVIL